MFNFIYMDASIHTSMRARIHAYGWMIVKSHDVTPDQKVVCTRDSSKRCLISGWWDSLLPPYIYIYIYVILYISMHTSVFRVFIRIFSLLSECPFSGLPVQLAFFTETPGIQLWTNMLEASAVSLVCQSTVNMMVEERLFADMREVSIIY